MRSQCSSGKKLKSDLGWGKTTTSNPKVEDRSNVLLEVELSILDCNALANITDYYEYNSTEEYEYEEYEYDEYEFEDYNDTSCAESGDGKGACKVKDYKDTICAGSGDGKSACKVKN